MTKKRSLNDELVTSEPLEQAYRVCKEAALGTDVQMLQEALKKYRQCLQEEIKKHLGTAETPRQFDIHSVEIHPQALDNFVNEMKEYFIKLSDFVTKAIVRDASNDLVKTWLDPNFPSEIYCLWKTLLDKSDLKKCIISAEELARRKKDDEAKIKAEEKKLADRVARQQWLLVGAQIVGGVAASVIVPGAAFAQISGRVALGTAGAALLHAGFVATDNVASGEAISRDLGDAALQGAKAGAVGAVVGETLGLVVGRLRPSTPSPVDTAAKVVTPPPAPLSPSPVVPHAHAVRGAHTTLQAAPIQAAPVVTKPVFSAAPPKIIPITPVGQKQEVVLDAQDDTKTLDAFVEEDITIEKGDVSRLCASLFDCEMAIFKQLTKGMRSINPSFDRELALDDRLILQASLRRLEELLNTLKIDNTQMDNDLERELSALERQVSQTHKEMMLFNEFTRKMKEWSQDFFSKPKECTLKSLFMKDVSIEQDKPPVKSTEAVSQNRSVIVTDASISSSQAAFFASASGAQFSPKTLSAFEQKFERLLAECSKEGREGQKLYLMLFDGTLAWRKERARTQASALETMKSENGLAIQKWQEWQKRMIDYLSMSRAIQASNLTITQETVATTAAESSQSTTQETHYVP